MKSTATAMLRGPNRLVVALFLVQRQARRMQIGASAQ